MPEYNCFGWDLNTDHPAAPIPAPTQRSSEDSNYLILLLLLCLASGLAGGLFYMAIAPRGGWPL